MSRPIRTGKNIIGVVVLQEDLVQGAFVGVDILAGPQVSIARIVSEGQELKFRSR